MFILCFLSACKVTKNVGYNFGKHNLFSNFAEYKQLTYNLITLCDTKE